MVDVATLLIAMLGTGAGDMAPICRISGDVTVFLATSDLTGGDLVAAGICRDVTANDGAVARLPVGAASHTLSCSQLAGLAARVPAGPEIRCPAGDEHVRLVRAREARAGTCFELGQGVRRGDVIGPEILEPADCARGAASGVVAAGVELVAARDLLAGEVFGPLKLPLVPVASAGDDVFGAVNAGPVRIDRAFKVLQPAWPGRDVFARDLSGKVVVLSVPAADEGRGAE